MGLYRSFRRKAISKRGESRPLAHRYVHCLSSPLSKLAPIAAVLISVFLLISGNALVGVVVPVRGSLDGFGELTVGLLGSAYFGGMLAGTALTPAMVRRAGHIRAFSAFVAWAWSATVLLPARSPRSPGLFRERSSALCSRASTPSSNRGSTATATNANRGALYAVYQTVSCGADAIGQLCMRGLDPRGFLPFSVGAALYGLAIVPLAMTNAEAPELPRSVSGQMVERQRLSAVSALAGARRRRLQRRHAFAGPGLCAADRRRARAGAVFHRLDHDRHRRSASIPSAGCRTAWTGGSIMALVMAVGAASKSRSPGSIRRDAPSIALGFLVGLTTYSLYTLAVSHRQRRRQGARNGAHLGRPAVRLLRRRDHFARAGLDGDAHIRAVGAVLAEPPLHAALAAYVGWELFGDRALEPATPL